MAELTVVIPCYNESQRLDRLFALIRKRQDLDWEWLFVDDGSTDNTAAVIQSFAAEFPDRVRLETLQRNCGKGAAVRKGMKSAAGDLIGFVDADLAASPIGFQAFLLEPDIQSGESLILGIRLKTHDGKVKRLLYRHLMGRFFQTLVSNITGLDCYDTQCGFKLMSRDLATRLAEQMECNGFCFDVELLMLADRWGVRLREEPVAWEEQGNSRVRPRHVWKMFLDIWRIARRVRRIPKRDLTDK